MMDPSRQWSSGDVSDCWLACYTYQVYVSTWPWAKLPEVNWKYEHSCNWSFRLASSCTSSKFSIVLVEKNEVKKFTGTWVILKEFVFTSFMSSNSNCSYNDDMCLERPQATDLNLQRNFSSVREDWCENIHTNKAQFEMKPISILMTV